MTSKLIWEFQIELSQLVDTGTLGVGHVSLGARLTSDTCLLFCKRYSLLKCNIGFSFLKQNLCQTDTICIILPNNGARQQCQVCDLASVE